jgi:Endoplasmic reticulum vesicle transporter.
MFNYYIKIIPTIYERLDGSKLFSNQFSVTKHSKTVGAFSGGGDGGMPGIFFSYELSPLMVKITEKSK